MMQLILSARSVANSINQLHFQRPCCIIRPSNFHHRISTMEVNPITSKIEDLNQRIASLRGYL